MHSMAQRGVLGKKMVAPSSDAATQLHQVKASGGRGGGSVQQLLHKKSGGCQHPPTPRLPAKMTDTVKQIAGTQYGELVAIWGILCPIGLPQNFKTKVISHSWNANSKTFNS